MLLLWKMAQICLSSTKNGVKNDQSGGTNHSRKNIHFLWARKGSFNGWMGSQFEPGVKEKTSR